MFVKTEKDFLWQGKADRVDLSAGKTVIRNAERFTFEMRAGETRWFKKSDYNVDMCESMQMLLSDFTINGVI